MGHHEDFVDPSPIRGLPGPLPEGETLLWQGSPSWQGLAVRAYHVRLVAIYFVILFIWDIAAAVQDGAVFADAALGAMSLFLPATFLICLILVYARLTARDTVYTITSRRIALHYGLILPRTINLPFAAVEGAFVKRYKNGTGDLPVKLTPKVRMAYLQLWPNARPWFVKHPEPMMRSIPDVDHVAQLLADALKANLLDKQDPGSGTSEPVRSDTGQAA